MSTKCTIGYGKKYHLFEEIFDSEKVWIQLDSNSFNAQLTSYHNEPSLVVGIDIATWREIVNAWNNSPWAKDLTRDYSKSDVEEFFSIFDKIKKDKPSGEE